MVYFPDGLQSPPYLVLYQIGRYSLWYKFLNNVHRNRIEQIPFKNQGFLDY